MATDIGKRLQEARRRKEISLLRVSQETKIGKDYLEALEKEEYDVFPAKIYVVSFLRSYARYLGLDAESLVNIYKKDHYGQRDRIDLNPEFPIVVSQSAGEKSVPRGRITRVRFTWKGLVPFIVAIVLIVGAGLSAIFYLHSASHRLSQQGMSKINVSAIVPRDISTVAEINGETWLRVMGDGVVTFEGTLFPGEKRTWVAKNEMNIRIGNVDALKLYVNGQKVDTISGNLGKVNELTCTRLKGKNLIKIEQKLPLTIKKTEPLESKLQKEENK